MGYSAKILGEYKCTTTPTTTTATATIILLKKQPKRLDPDEIKARQALERKTSQEANYNPNNIAPSPSPLPEPKRSLNTRVEESHKNKPEETLKPKTEPPTENVPT